MVCDYHPEIIQQVLMPRLDYTLMHIKVPPREQLMVYIPISPVRQPLNGQGISLDALIHQEVLQVLIEN